MNNKITNFQLSCIVFFISRSLFFICGYSTFINIGNTNTIISIILGTLLGLLIIKIYNHIINNKIIDFKAIQIITILLLIFMLSFIIKKYTNFIVFNYLPTTNPFIIILSIIILVIYLIKNNIDTIYRMSEIFIYIFMFLFIISTIGCIKYVDINNIKPLLNSNIYEIIKSTIIYTLFTTIPLIFINNFNIENKNKTLTKSYLISSLIILITYIQIIGILSINLSKIYTYPETIILKKISFFNFIERIENILSIEYLLDGIVLIIIIFYNIKYLLKSLIKEDKLNKLITIISIFILIISNITNINNSYFYISLLLFFIISILLSQKKTN